MSKETRTVHVKVTSNVGSVTKQTSAATKSTKGLAAGLRGVSTSAAAATGGIRAMAMALISSGVGAIVVALGSFVSLLGQAATTGAKFQAGMSKLRAVNQENFETTKELNLAMAEMSNKAKELGRSTNFTAMEVLALETNLSKMGFTAREVVAATESVLYAANALDSGLAETAGLVGGVIKAYSLNAEETARVADVLALSSNKSRLGFESLTEAFAVAGPMAAAAGVSLEQTAAYLALTVDELGKGSVAGTAFSQMLIEVRSKGLTMQQAFDKINGSSDKLGTAMELAGKRGGKALLVIAKQSVDSESKLAQLTTAFESADGAAKRMSDTMTDNLTGDFKKLSSAWEGLILGMEDGNGVINRIGRGAVQFLTTALGQLSLASEFLGFTFEHLGGSITDFRLQAANDVSNIRTKILMNFRIMALKAMEYFADVPLLGKAINKDEVSSELKKVEDAYSEHLGKQAKIDEEFAKRKDKRGDFWQSWETRKTETAQRIQKAAKEKKEQEDAEKQAKVTEEQQAELAAANEKRKQFKAKLDKADEDQEDKTERQKIERKRDREIAELEALKYNKDEEAELKEQIRLRYKEQLDAQLLSEKEAENLKKYEDLALTKEQEALDFEAQRIILQERREIIMNDELLSEEQKLAFLKSIKEAEQKIEDTVLANKEKQDVRTKSNIKRMGLAIAQEAGIGKEVAIAQATYQTYKNATDARASQLALATPDAPARAAIAMASEIGIGIMNVKSIMKTKIPRGGGGGGSAPSMSSGGSKAPSINVIDSGTVGEQRIESAINQGNSSPTRAYIVESDLTSQSQLSRRVDSVSSLG
jgi:hypothetical protein